MYFEELNLRKSINCASAHQNDGFRLSEKKPKCQYSLCFSCFRVQTCCHLGKTFSCLRLNYMWSLHSWINLNFVVRSFALWKMKFMYDIGTNISVAFLQLPVNRLLQFDSFSISSFLATFLIVSQDGFLSCVCFVYYVLARISPDPEMQFYLEIGVFKTIQAVWTNLG